jgi:AbrB family looped-hinge helix DNA binding protein
MLGSSLIVHRAKADAQGRVLIPADIREAMGVKPGETLILKYQDNELRVLTWDENVRQIQESAAKYSVPGESSVDALIAERRAEQTKEDAEVEEYRRRHGIPDWTPEELARREEEAREFLRNWAERHPRD